MKKWWKKKMNQLVWKLPGNSNTLVCGTGRCTYLRCRTSWSWVKWQGREAWRWMT